MLYIFFTLIFLLPVWAGFGRLINGSFGGTISEISPQILVGISSITLLFSIISFYIPLNLYLETAIIFIGFFSFFYFKIYYLFWNFLRKQPPIFYIISIIILFCGSFAPFILDHFGYYVPSIKWLTEFGLVKGISNLDLILGQMSLWHIFQAGFSNFSDPFLRINTLLLIAYLIYIFEKKSWIHLLFLPVLLLFSQSPSPDLPVIIFSLIVLNEIFTGNKNSKVLFAFSVFIFAIKPTMIWVPLFVFLNSVFVLKHNLKFSLGGILILTLFLFKNIWTFGYPIFPVSIGDLGIYWKPNSEILKISAQTAVEKTYDMQFSYAEIQKFSTWEHIKNWLFLKGIKSGINISFTVILLFFSTFTFIKKNRLLTLFWISLILKTALVLLFSAQYRFFLDVFFVIIFIFLFEKISQKQSIFIFSTLSFLVLFYLSFPKFLQQHFPSFKPGQYMAGFKTEQAYKPSTYEYKKFKHHTIGNLRFNMTEAYPFSFDTSLPAISPSYLKSYSDAGIFPQKISSNIKNGFIWKKINDSEKKKLTEIYDNWVNHYPKNPDNK